MNFTMMAHVYKEFKIQDYSIFSIFITLLLNIKISSCKSSIFENNTLFLDKSLYILNVVSSVKGNIAFELTNFPFSLLLSPPPPSLPPPDLKEV